MLYNFRFITCVIRKLPKCQKKLPKSLESKSILNKKCGLKIYGEDGVHPNAEGYKIMETLLLKALPF
jgi:hypothetical protein